MGHIRDMHLKMPAFRPPFDVDGIIEITRCLPVNRYDWQMAKIPAALAFGVPYRPRGLPRLLDHVLGELVRQMMFADQNFHIDAEFARPPQEFDYAARRRNA